MMGRIEDLGLVADKGLEWKAKCEAATAERDQLRAEVRSAKKKISVMGGEWMAEAKRAVAAEEKLSAATARAEASESLLRDLATILNPHEAYDSTKLTGWARDTVELAGEADRAESTAAGLRRALEGLVVRLDEVHNSSEYKSVWGCYMIHGGDYSNGPKYDKELAAAQAAIAATSAEHERKLKAEGAAEKLNEMADGGLNWDAVTLRREAESVLLEATNGR